MFKTLMDSVFTDITSRIDGIVKYVADLKASLHFSQNDISEQKDKTVSMDADVSSLQETVNKYFRRPFIWKIKVEERISTLKELVKILMKSGKIRKRKLRTCLSRNWTLILLLKSTEPIELVVLQGKMEPRNRELLHANSLATKRNNPF